MAEDAEFQVLAELMTSNMDLGTSDYRPREQVWPETNQFRHSARPGMKVSHDETLQ